MRLQSLEWKSTIAGFVQATTILTQPNTLFWRTSQLLWLKTSQCCLAADSTSGTNAGIGEWAKIRKPGLTVEWAQVSSVEFTHGLDDMLYFQKSPQKRQNAQRRCINKLYQTRGNMTKSGEDIFYTMRYRTYRQTKKRQGGSKEEGKEEKRKKGVLSWWLQFHLEQYSPCIVHLTGRAWHCKDHEFIMIDLRWKLTQNVKACGANNQQQLCRETPPTYQQPPAQTLPRSMRTHFISMHCPKWDAMLRSCPSFWDVDGAG